MEAFELKQKTTSEKTGLISYQFENKLYMLTVYTFEENGQPEIQYPIVIKAKGEHLDIAPDVKISSEEAEICPPLSISLEQLPLFQDYLEQIPEMVRIIQKTIQNVREKNYDKSRTGH